MPHSKYITLNISKKKKLSPDELEKFINDIGRTLLPANKEKEPQRLTFCAVSHYLDGIYASFILQGYDEQWLAKQLKPRLNKIRIMYIRKQKFK